MGKDRIRPMLAKGYPLVLFCLIFCADFPLSAQQSLEPFSADSTDTVNGETHSSKIYSDGHSIRMEVVDGVQGQSNVTFVRLDSGLTQAVIPRERAYSEYPYGAPSAGQFIRYLRGAKVENKLLGVERVDGQECEKFLVKATNRDYMYSSIEWRSRGLHGFVVKRQDSQGQWSASYRNVHLGAQAPSFFQVPAGYTRIAYSQDWTGVVKQIQFAGGLSNGIAIARKAGLEVIGDDGTPVTESTRFPGDFIALSYVDPVTGSMVLDESVNIDYFPTKLPAPILMSPKDGSVFDHFPRKMKLQWDKVPGATSYVVQVDIRSVGGTEKPYWSTDKGLTYLQQTVSDPTFAFEFAGAQPGRWRVWAIDAHGFEGPKSDWYIFRFTQ
jgi:hypothetical protein